MHIHVFQHVSFENPAHIAVWAESNQHKMTYSKLWEQPVQQNELDDSDMLLIMGGPMGIFDYDEFSWLKKEKDAIAMYLQSGRKVMGICLGAQLIADIMGAMVYPGKASEIGWMPISFHNDDELPASQIVMHWHGDTFDIPYEAKRIASSEITPNQGFIVDNRVLALQFHIEMTETALAGMIENCGAELQKAEFVQSAEEVIENATKHLAGCQALLESWLDRFTKA